MGAESGGDRRRSQPVLAGGCWWRRQFQAQPGPVSAFLAPAHFRNSAISDLAM
ncbi:MAG TPA: hypothetical protein VMO88_10505 [Acidimicrobiales bacterium]|nr:hypothetical protein [Acidimicrobiales bacterium]